MRFDPILLLLAFLAVPSRDPPPADLQKIRGTWKIEQILDGGEMIKITPECRIVISAERMTCQHKDYPLAYEFRLDPSKNPKWIDLQSGGANSLGIYELQGDRLKIVLNERPQGERPNAFVSVLDSANDVLIILQRTK